MSDTFVTRVKNHGWWRATDGFRASGLQEYDPRAKIVKKTADEILHKLGGQ